MTLESQAQRGGIKLTLQAEDLAGLSEGAPLWFKGLQIGQLGALTLDAGGNASVELLVNERYRHLLQRARFYRAAPLQVEADLSGIKVETSPASAWLAGASSWYRPRRVTGLTASTPARSWPCLGAAMPKRSAGRFVPLRLMGSVWAPRPLSGTGSGQGQGAGCR